MNPAIHRSITFWSGISVMAFVVWAWFDSTRALTMGSLEDCLFIHSDGAFSCTDKPSYFSIQDSVARMPISVQERGLGFVHAPVCFKRADHEGERGPFGRIGPVAGRDFGKVPELHFSIVGIRRDFANWGVFVPHWLLLLIFAIPWVVLISWRARRRRRAGTPIG